MAEAHQVSSGVQELIERLRQEGVEAGRQEAERLVAAARREAEEIVAQARQDAEASLARARGEISAERDAAHEALKLAVRDATLALESQITARFTTQLRRLVATETRDPELLRQMILALAARTGAELRDKSLTLVLPEQLADPASAATTSLFARLTAELSAELLRDGIEITTGDGSGLKVRIVEDDVEIDFSEGAVSRLLLAHLTPRFRELLTGLAQ